MLLAPLLKRSPERMSLVALAVASTVGATSYPRSQAMHWSAEQATGLPNGDASALRGQPNMSKGD